MRHYSHARAVYESRIVARVRWLVQTGQLEGTNNTISYRNSAFVFLKIKAASPETREELFFDIFNFFEVQ